MARIFTEFFKEELFYGSFSAAMVAVIVTFLLLIVLIFIILIIMFGDSNDKVKSTGYIKYLLVKLLFDFPLKATHVTYLNRK
jgi:hypothetical protein